jgi:hypothetical protein
MPHAVEVEEPVRARQPAKTKATSSRELRQLYIQYNKIRNHYLESNAFLSITRLLESKNRPTVTKAISLGLGSLHSADQSRRIKQLVIFLAIAEQLRQHNPSVELYAQDPSFSKIDEAFLQSLGVHILSTPSAIELGDATQVIDNSTLVYCPFLTLEAYRLLLDTGNLNFFIGDNFDVLRNKWPKHSPARNEAESLLRRFMNGFQKRTIDHDAGFWNVEDRSFPMAMYWSTSRRQQARPRGAML